MEIRILGPVELWHAGRLVRLTRRQQRQVLGILSLTPNRLVSRDHLIDLLWGEQAPHQARAVVQTRISELRAAISVVDLPDPDVQLLARGDGYVLEIPSDRIDANEFRRAVKAWPNAPSDEAARETLRRGLALWRGRVLGEELAGDPDGLLGQNLEAMRLTATEDLFELELRLGNHRQVVDDIIERSVAHPTRERLVELMMTALHRAGRTAEGLQAYDRWRRWLRDELGVDPGASLQRRHLVLLNDGVEGDPPTQAGDPDTDSAGAAEQMNGFRIATPRLLPPDTPDFAGRAREVALLCEKLTCRTGIGPVIVAISGPGGVGKTALSVRTAHGLLDEFRDGQLYADLRGAEPGSAVQPAEVLGGFLRALGVDGLAMPADLGDRVNLYRNLIFDQRVLVVLDNAADDDQVLPLIPGGSGCAVLINSRARLGTTIGAFTFELDVLDAADAAELLRSIVGPGRLSAEPDAAATLAERCGYLPLAIRVVAAKLVAKPHWRIEKMIHLLDERHGLSHLAHGRLDVRASIALSYQGLQPPVRQLLRGLGDLNLSEVSVWLCAALMHEPQSAAEDLVEQLFDARLVDYRGRDSTGGPRYVLHDLVRLFARERAAEEPTAEVAAASRRALGALLLLSDAVYRVMFGGDYLTIHGGAARFPVDDNLLEAAVADPLRWFEVERSTIVHMIQNAAREGYAEICWDLACTTSALFPIRGYHEDWREVLDCALAATETAGDDRGRAAILYRMGMFCADRQQPDLAWTHLQRAAGLFERVGDAHGHAVVLAYLAMTDRFRGRLSSAMQNYRAAIAGLATTGDAGGEAFALRGLGQTYLEQGDYAAAEHHFDRAMELYAKMNGALRGQAQVLLWQGMLRLKQGLPERAEPIFAEVLTLSRSVGDPYGEAQAMRGLGICYQEKGQPAESRAVLREALDLVRQPRPTLVEAHIRRTIADLHGKGMPGLA